MKMLTFKLKINLPNSLFVGQRTESPQGTVEGGRLHGAQRESQKTHILVPVPPHIRN